MLKSNDIEKKSAKSYKTGVILVIYGISQFCHALLLLPLLPIELQYLNNRNTNKHEILHVYIFYYWHVHNVVIFSLTLSLLVLLIVISPNNALQYADTLTRGGEGGNPRTVRVLSELL